MSDFKEFVNKELNEISGGTDESRTSANRDYIKRYVLNLTKRELNGFIRYYEIETLCTYLSQADFASAINYAIELMVTYGTNSTPGIKLKEIIEEFKKYKKIIDDQ